MTQPRKRALTKAERVKEIIKCGKDPVYFINTYIKIQHPIRGRIPFETYDFQDKLVNSIKEHRFNIILKSRQLGISTIGAAYAVWYAIFHKDKNTLIIATKLATAMNFIKKVKIALSGIPSWLILPKYEASKQAVSFSNGSQIIAVPTSEDAGRSEALSLLIVDEAAFIRNFEDIWTAAYPTISCLTADTKVLTPSGFVDIQTFCQNKKPGDYFELKTNIWGKNGFEETSHGYVSPKSETRRFTTKSGRIIECTLEHPLYCTNETKTGMISAKNIKLGDALRVHHSMNVFGKNQILSIDDAYLLGIYSAEGWIPQQKKDPNAKRCSVYISNSEIDIREFLIQRGFKTLDGIKLAKFSVDLVEWFIKVGVDPKQKCNTKRIPGLIWSSPEHIQKSYLQGYFDGDGCASSGVCANSTSQFLLQDIQLMLLNMGLLPRVRAEKYDPIAAGVGTRRMPSGQILRSVKQSYRLTIPRSQLLEFQRKVGFRCNRKVTSLQNICKKFSSAQGKSSRLFELPQSAVKRIDNLIRKKIKECNISFSNLRYNHSFRYEKNPTQLKVEYFVKLYNSLQFTVPEELNEFCGNHYYDTIIKIENGFAETYDFTVPKTHTFLQNGILGSNTGGRALILSTPNGVGGQYYKLWTDAVAGQNEFKTTELHWQVHPEHDQKWFEKETRNLSPRKIGQEFMCDFISSGDTFLEVGDLEYIKDLIKEPIEKMGFDRNVWVWQKPVPGNEYVISADVARGDAADYSTFHIFDYSTCNVVAEYMGKLPPEKLAALINEFGRMYNDALAIPENNTFGYFTCTMLRDHYNYPRLWNKHHKGPPMLCYTSSDQDTLPGFSTQGNTRPLILTKLEELIRNRALRTYSRRLHDQLQSFIWNNGKPSAQRDSHDDLVMSLAIGAWLCGGAFNVPDAAVAQAMAMARATGKMIKDQNDLPGGIQQVQPLVDPNIRGMNPQSLHRPRDPSLIKHVDVSDFSWLLD